MNTVSLITSKTESPKVRLSPMISEALPLIISWAEKAENAEFFRRFPPMCDWVSWERAMLAFGQMWLVNEGDKIVGVAGLFSHDIFSHHADFGILVDNETSKQRSETCRQASFQVWEYGFNYLRLNKINIKILTNRSKLAKRMESCGFKLDGILRSNSYFQEQYVDEMFYSCLKSDYVRGNG